MMLCFLGCSSGCVLLTESGRDLYSANNLVLDKKYNDAIATYRKILHDNPDSYYAADAKYGLGMAHIAFENPHKNYAQALQEFEAFVKLAPNDGRVPDVQNWISILRTIEDLKRLDIRHEERRRK